MSTFAGLSASLYHPVYLLGLKVDKMNGGKSSAHYVNELCSIGIGTFLAPESPWWCVRHGYKERAEVSLKRLARSSGFSQRDADAAMACKFDDPSPTSK